MQNATDWLCCSILVLCFLGMYFIGFQSGSLYKEEQIKNKLFRAEKLEHLSYEEFEKILK